MTNKIPTPRHQFVNADGSRAEYVQQTKYPCDVCNPDGRHEDRYMCERFRSSRSVHCECPNCGHDQSYLESSFNVDHS